MKLIGLKYAKGTAIVEALMAMLLISLAFMSASAAVSSSMRLAAVARDQLIAANLAQEGIELVHRIRDNNWISGVPFTVNLAPGTYRIDYNDDILIPSASCPAAVPLFFDASTGLYSYDFGTASRFCRHITIAWSGSPVNEIRVNSVVTWTTRGFNYSLNVESHLFNWF